MKANRKWVVPVLVLIGLCVALLTVIANRPPGTLDNSGYYIRGSKVYYHPGFPGSPSEIQSADANTFVILDVRYGLDTAQVYINGASIPGADPSTFELLSDPFTRDANHVYVGGERFSDDPAHFERVDGNIYRDSQHIYWSTTIVSDDPSHLVVLGSSGFYTYFKDSTAVYINGSLIRDADPVTFAMVNEGFSLDAANIFYFDQIILGADLATFQMIVSPFARDAAHVYFMENALPDADPSTFIVLNVDFQCSADATHAYYQGDLIPNFDPANIPANAVVTNCDGAGIYFSP